ncbi:uracil phosphoribosyltransferase [Halolactibacillus alkaliphilus]|uniref:Uracil phosphoribosyltransferase n=1 Tax=Halolactibacillus alkaliphilus TaxID=442899 RepID=A0A511X201_9BACI|nr:CopY/TcrY family copper transport repressor [Halolactibacillus alkaliphilus]GEN56974.1 uracil phosphoribosyltransferase [Halolactibacillus alkaliphilus]GGN71556.1 uracil phosphoribosyltransferase [Halolactibacillus alkaliphilus]
MAIEMDKDITNAEWEVMRVVWAQTEVPSHVIIDVLTDKRGWKEPTIKTLIGRLVKKGALKTKKDGRKFLYSTDIKEDTLVNETLDQFFHNICSKDIGKTIGVLIDEAMLSHDDVALLKEKLKQKEPIAYDTVLCNCVKGQCQCQHHG